MTTQSPLAVARTMVRSDALFCMALGAAFVLASASLAAFTGLPIIALQVMAVGSFVWGVYLYTYSTRAVVRAPFLSRLAVINGAAAVVILLAALSGLVGLTSDGVLLFIALAAAVAFFGGWAYLAATIARSA